MILDWYRIPGSVDLLFITSPYIQGENYALLLEDGRTEFDQVYTTEARISVKILSFEQKSKNKPSYPSAKEVIGNNDDVVGVVEWNYLFFLHNCIDKFSI